MTATHPAGPAHPDGPGRLDTTGDLLHRIGTTPAGRLGLVAPDGRRRPAPPALVVVA
ncbi:sirohydrochlorin chelatase, partial [Streptomyces sp. SID7958]|nr:sirohydrochlorin chelatase [Streptomyces sp. SID7958]